MIGAIAAGGAAYTAGNTVPATVAGYGSVADHRRNRRHSLTYKLSADGTTITRQT